MALSESQIEQLWVSQGGDPKYARLMAKIALRESRGRPEINNRGLNKNGTVDWGLFQVNDIWRKDPVVGPLFQSGKILTPEGAAQAAIRILKVQGPKAWATYNPSVDSKYLGGFSGATSSSTPSAGATRTTATTTTTPGVDNSAARRNLIVQYLATRHNPDALVALAAGMQGAKDTPATTSTSTKTSRGRSGSGTGTAASPAGSGAYPVAKLGKIIGTPYAGTHSLGNWQSDNAVDIAVPVGTPMVALQDGVVVKVRKHPQGSGRFAGDQITVRGANGNEYFYAHGSSSVKAGQKIRKGQSLGVTGSANGVAHLHFGQMNGDPRQHTGGHA